MSKDWYRRYKLPYESEEFDGWWNHYYGTPNEVSPCKAEQDEYWIRKGFALDGWCACARIINSLTATLYIKEFIKCHK